MRTETAEYGNQCPMDQGGGGQMVSVATGGWRYHLTDPVPAGGGIRLYNSHEAEQYPGLRRKGYPAQINWFYKHCQTQTWYSPVTWYTGTVTGIIMPGKPWIHLNVEQGRALKISNGLMGKSGKTAELYVTGSSCSNIGPFLILSD